MERDLDFVRNKYIHNEYDKTVVVIMINTISNNVGGVGFGFDTLSSRLEPSSRKKAKEFIEKNSGDKEIERQTNLAEKQKVNYSELENEVRQMLSTNNLSIEFSIDDSSKQMIMRVIDSETSEVIKQFPSEVSLKIARILTNTLDTGTITNVKV
jgi:flagellar protein FlaG